VRTQLRKPEKGALPFEQALALKFSDEVILALPAAYEGAAKK
jgi:hypothetical protein